MFHSRTECAVTARDGDKATLVADFEAQPGRGQEWACRALDVAIALLALAVLAPLLAVVAALVWLQDGGSPFYCDPRMGVGAKRFNCFKFRSMRLDARERLEAILATDEAARQEWQRNQKLRNDPRVTPLGRWLRISSFDEVPQLLNVLRGEMSLVGPRPINASEIARYGDRFHYYCMVRPGITGLSQVSGRSNLAYAERIRLDTEYVRRRSLDLNLLILIKTVPAVLFARGSC